MKVARREAGVALVFLVVSVKAVYQRVNGVRSPLCKCGTRNECMILCECVCVCDGMRPKRCESDLQS